MPLYSISQQPKRKKKKTENRKKRYGTIKPYICLVLFRRQTKQYVIKIAVPSQHAREQASVVHTSTLPHARSQKSRKIQ
jgi:hypothetical protein